MQPKCGTKTYQLMPLSDFPYFLHSLLNSMSEMGYKSSPDRKELTSIPLLELNSFKKICMLTNIHEKVIHCCYVTKRKLIVLLLEGGKTVKFVSTYNFKTVLVKIFGSQIHVITHAKELDEIILAGEKCFIEIFNLRKLKSKDRSIKDSNICVTGAVYLPSHKKYAFALENYGICFISSDFKHIRYARVHNRNKIGKEMIHLHPDILLVTEEGSVHKKILIMDLKTDQQILAPGAKLCRTGYIGRSHDDPDVIFIFKESYERSEKETYGVDLLTFDSNTFTPTLIQSDKLLYRIYRVESSNFYFDPFITKHMNLTGYCN